MKNDMPLSAFQFLADVELGDNGEGSKSAPVVLTARTGDAIDHPAWGRVVHDMDGMQLHKSRVPIDYNHTPEMLGYLNRFDTESGDLVAGGALTPFGENDRTSEVMHKMRQGVPYEASINFAGKVGVEKVKEGRKVTVNGREFSGPITVIREWPLRGVAIAPYGADMNTNAMAFNQQSPSVEVFEMATDETQTAEEVVDETPSVDAAADAAEVNDQELSAPEETVEAAPAEETVAEPVDAEMSEGQRFLEAFGDRGGVWFAQGKSFDEAMSMHVQSLEEENQRLRSELAQRQSDGEPPAEFSEADSEPDTKKIAKGYEAKGVSGATASFAAAFEKRLSK